MSGKTLLEVESPKTQSVEAVQALLMWKGVSSDPLPSEVSLGDGRLMLILSNKKDCYYCVTPRDCSCPARNYQPQRPCKHMRKYFKDACAKPAQIEEGDMSLISGSFKPVQPEYAETPQQPKREPARASSSLLVDAYAFQPTQGEIEYWQQREKAEAV